MSIRMKNSIALLAPVAIIFGLALTRLVTEDRETGMENRHFRETVEEGVMRFDYRLREGPAATRNAIRVLEAQGYPEEITREARERVAQTSMPPARPEGS